MNYISYKIYLKKGGQPESAKHWKIIDIKLTLEIRRPITRQRFFHLTSWQQGGERSIYMYVYLYIHVCIYIYTFYVWDV